MKDKELHGVANKMIKMLPLTILSGIIPDLLIAYGILIYLGSTAPSFWIVFLAIQGLRIIRRAYGSATSWLIFRLYGKSVQVAGILHYLNTNKFPAPRFHHTGQFASQYFLDVSYDAEVPIDTRLMARQMYGSVETIRQQGNRAALQYDAVLEAAFKRYESRPG
jgi:hypothetical protein